MSDNISSKFKDKKINIKDYATINLASFEKTADRIKITDYLKEGKSPIGGKTINMKFGEQNYAFYTVKSLDIKVFLQDFMVQPIKDIQKKDMNEQTIMTKIKKFIDKEIQKQGSPSLPGSPSDPSPSDPESPTPPESYSLDNQFKKIKQKLNDGYQVFFPSNDTNVKMKLRTNLGLGIAGLSTTDPLIKDIQTHIDKLKKDKKFNKNIFFGTLVAPFPVIASDGLKFKATIQVWGANKDNIHVDTLDKLNKYINTNGTLGEGQAIIITKILQSGNADGLVIGINTMSPYIKTGAPGASGVSGVSPGASGVSGVSGGGKKTRKHKGIVQIGGNIGRLRKGYNIQVREQKQV